MGLMDRLREAEEQGKEAARNAYERARDLGEDVQRRLRQKMRIYPAVSAARMAAGRTEDFLEGTPTIRIPCPWRHLAPYRDVLPTAPDRPKRSLVHACPRPLGRCPGN